MTTTIHQETLYAAIRRAALATTLCATMAALLPSCAEDREEPQYDAADTYEPLPESSLRVVSSSVDLGLSVKWCTCNLGAQTPEGLGGFFSYGELRQKGRDEYRWADYSLKDDTAYLWKTYGETAGPVNPAPAEDPLSNICGNSQFDAATYWWGEGYRLPTQEEVRELHANCTFESVLEDEKVIGYVFTSKLNGATVYFPNHGYRADGDFRTEYGCYWAGELGYDLGFGNSPGELFFIGVKNTNGVATFSRAGHQIRPVCTK